ncbi:MAG: family oxidoreductase, partial [Acidimicrobiaceae bacterium]|nr:family oxidoreductase [Acidimicrobiaceae bacterium]
AYVAAKHGVVGLTKCMAAELASYRIRVNAICPGVIRTPMTEAYFSDPERVAALNATIPLGHPGEPRHVADAALFLASDSSEYVTGVALPLDGGFLAEKSLGGERR